METGKMRVFHGVRNYGTQSGFLARELRKNGIVAASVTKYDPFDRLTDVTLKNRGDNIVEKVYNYVWNQAYSVYCFFNYNIFHFYPGRTFLRSRWMLPLYRFFGKKVVFEYLGVDVQKYKYSVENFKYTNIIYKIDKSEAEEHDQSIDKMLKQHERYADLQLVCAPCYSPFVPGSTVLPLGLDLSTYKYEPMPKREGAVKIMHAPTHRGNKGTKFILSAIDRLIQEGYPVEKMLVENVSHDRLKEMYMECDIFVDQIMGGWYGTASVEAMALGRPVVCSIYEEFSKYVDYGDRVPMIHADPDIIYDVLKHLVDNRAALPEIGKKGREFVEEVHDIRKNAKLLIDLYQQI